MLHSVMQVDLNFSPARVTVFGKHLEQSLIVLFSGIEVGVDEGPSIMIAPAVDHFGIFAHPPFQAALLLRERDAFKAVSRNDGRFEMIGQGEDQMDGTAGRRLQRTPGRRGQDLSGISEFIS
jgi:hypothetical protein